MDKRKIYDKELSEIVSEIRVAGFEGGNETVDLNDESWMIYIRGGNDFIDLAYVSTLGDVFTTQTFRLEDSGKKQDELVNAVVEKYAAYDAKLEKIDNLPLGAPCTALGLVLGVFAFRAPGVVIGPVLGYLGSDLIRKSLKSRAADKLENYLNDRKVYLGQDALTRMVGEYKE